MPKALVLLVLAASLISIILLLALPGLWRNEFVPFLPMLVGAIALTVVTQYRARLPSDDPLFRPIDEIRKRTTWLAIVGIALIFLPGLTGDLTTYGIPAMEGLIVHVCIAIGALLLALHLVDPIWRFFLRPES